MFSRSRSSSPAARFRSSSLRSVSPTSEGWDKTLSTYSITGSVRSVEYGGNLRVWTAEMDGRIVIRAAARGEILFEASARESAFCTVLRKVSSKQIWAAFSDGFIRCYNSTNGNMEHEFVQHDGAVRSLASSPVSDYVYSGGDDWKVYQWSKSRCTYIRLFSGHSNGVQCVLVAPSTTNAGAMYATEDISEGNDEDGTIENPLPIVDHGELKDEFVLSGGDDMTIKVWDPMAPLQIETDEACLATLRGHSGSVRAIEIHPRSGYLWSGGDDCTIRVWNWRSEETRRCVAILRGQHSGPITSIAYVAPRMWSSGKDGFVVLWNTRQLTPLQRLRLAPRNVNCPILSMRRLYRAMHWTVWLGGPEGTIHVLHASEEEHGAGAVLHRHGRLRTLEKRKFPRSREHYSARKPHLIRLRERQREIEEQMRRYRMRLLEENILLPEGGAARVRGGTPSGGSEEDARIAEIEVLRATVAELENQVKAHEETIMRTTYIAKEKDGVIRSLTRQLSEKDSELRRIEKELNRSMTRHASPQEVGRTTPTQKEPVLQEGRDETTTNNAVVEPCKAIEQLQEQQKLEVEGLRRQLLDMQKYKELWEEKDNELRQAEEKIAELQASLDTERNFNSLTQELSRYSKEHRTPDSCRGQSKVHSPPYTPTTQHYYKRIFGTCWPDLEKKYQKDLKETLWAEYIDLIRNSDAVVREITYTTTNDCLIVDATIENKKTQSREIQNLIENHNFSRTLALHGILASSFLVSTRNAASPLYTVTAEEYEAVAAAKAKAEAERDDARQKLRGAEEGLESFRRQAESRRAQIAGLQSAASPTRPTPSGTRNAASPLYTVTAEEYEAVASSVLGASESSCRPQSSKWVRYHYNLGEACVPLVRHYRQLVEDILLLEFSRATRLPIDYSRRVVFVSGGSVAEFYVCPSKDTVDVDFLLRRHSFSTLGSLMQLSSSVRNQSLRTPSSEATVANVSPVMANARAHENIRMAPLGSKTPISEPWNLQSSNRASILKELELFRSRRALASSMRRLEATLNVSFDLPNRINPVASVDPSELQREPVYCVTLDEYHALLQQLSNAYRTQTDDDDESENGTRLWNEHVVARAEEERRFTRQMSRLEPWYADSGVSGKKRHYGKDGEV
ncbi:hypothetical protein MOQ_005148 [Trypanosoma cruzi marinkellei]|uniref:Uncharacterized protein n=1 Tax=Trypanosoma cruzi marinkellei TaxID=85056 RepID=K2MZ24_TRYCR|nr:hypothetical protein MOQ_005148 [Trypanosoma cruzi marinkellei]